jgi:hypothetical protein
MINTIAMLMIVYACLAISTNYEILTKASFTKITLKENIGDIAAGTTLHIGLRAISLLKSDVGEQVVNFDQFCELSGDGMELFMDADDCKSCDDMSLNFVMSTMLAAVLFVPSLLITISRMYSGYDINCSKSFLTILALCSIGLCLNTLWTFKLFCSDKFYEGLVPFDDAGTPYPAADTSYYVNYDYKWGWGVIFLVAGVVLKALEMMINCCVATPSITRDKKEQTIYEDIKEEGE